MPKAEWNTPAWREERDRQLEGWLGEDAARCVVMLSGIAEVWDDMVDIGEAEPARRDRAFVHALVHLQYNRFWQEHQRSLMPLIVVSINAWMDSNQMQETDSANERILAYSLRNLSYELASMAAFCVGGWEHLRAVSLPMRRFFVNDPYSEWEHRYEPG